MRIPRLRLTMAMLILFSRSFSQTDLTHTDPQRAGAALILDQPVHDTRLQNRQHQLVSSIGATPDGRQLYIAWYTGAADEGPGNYVTIAVSLDSGRTWRNDQLVIFPKDSGTRFFDPVFWTDPIGKLWFFYTVSMNNKHWDLKEGVNAMSIEWNGTRIHHSEPRLISYGVMMNKPVYISEKNIALFPVSVWQLGKDHSKEPGYVKDGTFVKSFNYNSPHNTFDGLTDYSAIPVLPDSMRTFDEHMIVQSRDNGDLLCLVRTIQGIYISGSSDYGKNWSALKPFTATGPTTSSRIYIGKLQSGNLLLLLNNGPTRNRMTAFISKDGGKTWPHHLLIDAREQVSYPDAVQTADGFIHITHDRDRRGAQEILYCRFTEADIIQGNTEAIFRTRVNP